MERILVIGCPGSGKSYFSKKLSNLIGIDVIHMDNIYWSKDKVSLSKEELTKKMEPIIAKSKWIIDGNYHDTLEMRMEKATDVFFLDCPREECIQGILERIGVVRDDIPWVEDEKDAKELIEWTKSYSDRTRDYEINLFNKFKNVKIHVFHSRNEVDEYLKKGKLGGL